MFWQEASEKVGKRVWRRSHEILNAHWSIAHSPRRMSRSSFEREKAHFRYFWKFLGRNLWFLKNLSSWQEPEVSNNRHRLINKAYPLPKIGSILNQSPSNDRSGRFSLRDFDRGSHLIHKLIYTEVSWGDKKCWKGKSKFSIGGKSNKNGTQGASFIFFAVYRGF